ncbi:N-acetylmuramoyl-L-alanine amidase family protein [Acinetobacter junii]|nr:N-acetylmuramoyl-L-alanine amidase [Acinetobacter junii]ENV52073.1 hypothetical protein F953_00485 [Acinetobacter junii CIP 107470 = MTCC 11364]
MKKLVNALMVSLIFLSNSCMANIIALDTGHTTKQTGATSATGINEYYYNLNMANTIHQLLYSAGVTVNRVPTNQPNIKLTERAKMFPKSNLFVSIHHDSIPNSLRKYQDQISGFSIFVSSKNPQYQHSLACASHVAANLRSIGEHPSNFHSMDIPGERKKLLDQNGVYQYDNLVVLKSSAAPALLIEIGVITNSYEANRLRNPQVIDRIAKTIAYSISTC